MKKRLISFVMAFCMLCSVMAPAAFAVSSEGQKEYLVVDTVPEDAIILSESVEILYFDPATGEQVSDVTGVQPRSSLYEVRASTIIYQNYGGEVAIGIQLRADNVLCLFKNVTGTWTVHDEYMEQLYSNAPFSYTQIVPRNSLNTPTYECPDRFSIGETVHVYWNYRITLVSGSILNGGQISGSNTCRIVR